MAMIVNGEKINDELIKQEAERLRPEYERAFAEMEEKAREAQLLDWSKENVIERVLISQKAKVAKEVPQSQLKEAVEKTKEDMKNKGVDLEKMTAKEAKQLQEAISEQLKVEQLLEEIHKDIGEPGDEQVREFYEENKEQFKQPEQIKVSHIVKHMGAHCDEAMAREQIEKACEELKSGASFELTARKYSDCADNDGDLGYIVKGQMVEEFEDVVFNMGINETSGVFTTRFGFHIAKVYDKKPEGYVELDEVKDEIAKAVSGQMKTRAVEKYVDELKSKAEIREI